MSARKARPGDPKKAVAYVRVSTDDQRLGPEAQRAAIETWAAREQIAVTAWHFDQGVSGGSELDDRPGLIAALGEMRAAAAGVLVVAKRDRLARDVAVATTIERAVATCGARVVAADGVGNGDSPADAFMRTILDAAAQYERALIRARTKAALAAKRAKGERAGRVPFGFRLSPDGRTIEEDPREQAIVLRVRQLRAGGRTLREIVREIAGAGLVSRAGRPLGLTQVARLTA